MKKFITFGTSISIISLLLSIVALVYTHSSSMSAIRSNELTQQQIQNTYRPWLRIFDEKIVNGEKDNEYFIIPQIQNISGGPAVSVSFRIGINENISEPYHTDMTILPGENFTLTSQKATGQKPKEGDIIKWIIEFKDINNKKWVITQEKRIMGDDLLKEEVYRSEEL